MKKLLTIFLFVALKANCQTIDSTFKPMTACKIMPFKAKFSDTDSVSYLGVSIVHDDLMSFCLLSWTVFNSKGIPSVSGNATITGTDYTGWAGGNLYPFQFVAAKYGMTFK